MALKKVSAKRSQRSGLCYMCAAVLVPFVLFWLSYGCLASQTPAKAQNVMKLPEATHESGVSIEAALQARRSVRSYSRTPLRLTDISQLLWAAQGVNRKNGMRTAPSAGALYPLEIYLVVGNVDDLPAGVYKYLPQAHEIFQVDDADKRLELRLAGLGQGCIDAAAAVIVIAGVYDRTAAKYGRRAERYVHLEAGHASQNIYLQAVSLRLGTVAVGAFDDERVKKTLSMDKDEYPLYIMPVGKLR